MVIYMQTQELKKSHC